MKMKTLVGAVKRDLSKGKDARMITAMATCINVIIPEGISAANVPPKITAADKITPPISFAVGKI